ncbi:MAG: phage major capsid protein [Planctomycetota bacterium]
MSRLLQRLREERGQVSTKQEALLNLAIKEKRGLTSEEKTTEAVLSSEYELRTAEIDRMQAACNHEIASILAAEDTTDGEPGMSFKDMRSGREIRALRPNESFERSMRAGSDLADSDEVMSVGRCIAAAVLNRPELLSSFEKRAMMGAVDAGGGYLLNPVLSGSVIDLARSASVCLRAGAQTIPMDSGELRIAKLATDPVGYWRAEGVKVTASAPTLSQAVLRPLTLAAIIPLSIEVLQDAVNVEAVVTGALQRSLGLALDQAALLGKGSSSEPCGIVNFPGVNAVTSCGAPAHGCVKAREAVLDILTANYPGRLEDLAWIQHPRTANSYDALADTLYQPLKASPWVAAPQRFMTTSLPINGGGGSNESTDIIGDFSQLLIGIRQQVNIRVLDSGSVTDADGASWSAESQLMKLVVAYMRADTVLLRPTWFSTISGITA